MTHYTIKTTVSLDSIMQRFVDYDRGNQFTLEALEEIMDNLEEIADNADEEIYFDVIGICCVYVEEDLESAIISNGFDKDDYLIEWEDDNGEIQSEIDTDKFIDDLVSDRGWAVLLENGNVVYSN